MTPGKRLRDRLRRASLRTVSIRRPAAIRRPVMIIGCGRSGTTILGELLSQHPRLTYFNEPRDLWLTDPRTDIWTPQAAQRGGTLTLTAADLNPGTVAQVRRAFGIRLAAADGERLVEKLPINSFRVDYINAIFPDALFIHLLRNGVEVAHSIAREAQSYAWYGHDDYKWRLLVDHARAQGLSELAALAAADFTLRGLLEWRLSVTAAQGSLAALPPARVLEIRYETLLADPAATYQQLEQFIGVAPDRAPLDFAATQLQRKHAPAVMTALDPEMQQIAGELLRQSGYLDDAGS